MREIKTLTSHYFEDSLGQIQGEGRDWHENGMRWTHMIYADGLWHGEGKFWNERGELTADVYFVNDVETHDFLANPLSDEERMLLVLKYGAPLLPKE